VVPQGLEPRKRWKNSRVKNDDDADVDQDHKHAVTRGIARHNHATSETKEEETTQTTWRKPEKSGSSRRFEPFPETPHILPETNGQRKHPETRRQDTLSNHDTASKTTLKKEHKKESPLRQRSIRACLGERRSDVDACPERGNDLNEVERLFVVKNHVLWPRSPKA
jgi:hypothetical protein